MRKFLLSVLLYSSVLIAAYVFYIAAIIHVLNDPEIYVIPSTGNTLILGDSHTASGVSNRVIVNSCNLSQSADPYFVVYGKLKRLTDANPQIKRVILGCAEHNVSMSIDARWRTNDGMLWKFDRAFYLIDPIDVIYLFRQNFKAAIRLFASIPREKTSLGIRAFKGMVNVRRLGVGHFMPLHQKLDIKSYAVQQLGDYTGYSETEIAYLHKIADLCKQRKIELILLSTPVVPFAGNDAGKVRFLKLLRHQFANVEFLDYSRFVLPDTCFADGTHLNASGARIFSTVLKEKLALMPSY